MIQEEGTRWHARIDGPSRRVLWRFGLELGSLAAIVATPLLYGAYGAVQAIATLGTFCSFTALLRMVMAARWRERPGGASLNSWDECLALTAAAMLAYAVARWLS